MTGPVVEFKPHGGNRINDVDAGDPRLETRRWTVLVVPGFLLLVVASVNVAVDRVFHMHENISLPLPVIRLRRRRMSSSNET